MRLPRKTTFTFLLETTFFFADAVLTGLAVLADLLTCCFLMTTRLLVAASETTGTESETARAKNPMIFNARLKISVDMVGIAFVDGPVR
ncbi:MAG: hypothetical protein Q7T46_05545 [Polaromonas sp.]|nr:hypothetical protein [Polaromonas sp.]